jgi:L-ascorbate 6-phosphate lactonase
MSDLYLQWVGGAGFIIKTGEVLIGVDLYLSNACMGGDGAFKRLTPPPVSPENLNLDFLIASHEHGDHFDTGSINIFLRPDNTAKLICPANTKAEAVKCGVDVSRVIELNRGQTIDFKGFSVRAVLSDHGDDSPDAIGFFLKMEGKTIYFMGDARFRTDMLEMTAPREEVDLLLVPINGKYGNPDAREAAYFTQMFKPKTVIPCHFWLFAEHGGDPGEFAEICADKAPSTKVKILAIGESVTI